MVNLKSSLGTLLAILALSGGVNAEENSQQNSQDIIEPALSRQTVDVDMSSNDFEVGIFGGGLNVDGDTRYVDSTTNAVVGARIGYHFTENLFIEASYSVTNHDRELTLYNAVLGYNFLQDTYVTNNYDMKTSLFFVLGAGITDYDGLDDNETGVFGAGYRIMFNDSFSMRFDVRGYVHEQYGAEDEYSFNTDMTLGFAYFF
ncbi:outer membrane beta-barrel domain-containing protein [Thalassotalea sp. HSM 43]|uniref:outer membrane beta-barrel domain-containing protein n=1 Tax=Thalassotalea sp. HSM 43 TaxID=2552945 RepID=UPI001081D17B|nr:outer membrane beta-barrel domain-containing protein [Thalassotalea sp. HSM 43]QBY03111.1 outer membrane beta-barrel domain-containing protein [Thalassotalea sp. HSM 43]